MELSRILITGANGFVGRHLIAHLLESVTETQGAELQIIAAVRPDEAERIAIKPETAGWSGRADPRIRVVPLDICDAAECAAVFQREQPSHFVHLAARSSGADVERDQVMNVNVGGTRKLLDAAALISPFPRTLVVSTGYVYGNTDQARPAREEDPIGPLWRYGAYTDSKIEMEGIARSYRGFVMTARAFAHTGPGQMPVFALPNFARQLALIEQGKLEPVIHVGNMEAKRDMLDVRDIVRGYALLLRHGRPGDVYNLATGKPLSMGEILTRLRALCRVPTEVRVDPARLRPAEIACSTGDPLHLWTTVNWSARIPFEVTLADTLEYWRRETTD